MELDQLKDLWQNRTNEHILHHQLKRDDITHILRQKSQHVLEKLKKNLLIEACIALLLGVVTMVAFCILPSPFLPWDVVILGIWIIIVTGLCIKAYITLHKLRLHDGDVKRVIVRLTQQMRFFLKLAHYYTMFLVPVFLGLGFLYGLIYSLSQVGKGLQDLSWIEWVFIGACLCLYVLLSVWLSGKYIYVFYGAHYETLVSYCEEIKEDVQENEQE